MVWWKKAIKYSAYWFLFIVLLTALGFFYIPYSQNLEMTLTESQKFEKLGNIIGFLWGIGLFPIWGLTYSKKNKNQPPNKSLHWPSGTSHVSCNGNKSSMRSAASELNR